MPKFKVIDHRVGSRNWEWGGHEVMSHTLELTGDTAEGGRAHRAILVFDNQIDPERLGAAVGYMTGSVDDGAAIVGWFPLDTFERYRDLLGGDGDVSVHFELRDEAEGQGYLRRLAIVRRNDVASASNGARVANSAMAPAAYAMPF
jgi:hypothetical protein